MAASQASSNQYGLSDQDFADLQQIRSGIPAGDPRAAKIDTLLASKPAAPKPSTATIGAAPTGVLPWLQNLEGDIRYGSNMTGPGRLLHKIGMQPTSAGVSEGVEQKMASPILGPLTAAQGAATLPTDPLRGAKMVAAGAFQTADLPMSFMAPEVSEAPELAGAASKVAGASKAGAEDAGTFLAKMLRHPATAAQSQAGQAGKVKTILPPFLQKWTVPEGVIPKGALGTATNPGPFARIPVKIPREVLAEAEQSASQAAPATNVINKSVLQNAYTGERTGLPYQPNPRYAPPRPTAAPIPKRGGLALPPGPPEAAEVNKSLLNGAWTGERTGLPYQPNPRYTPPVSPAAQIPPRQGLLLPPAPAAVEAAEVAKPAVSMFPRPLRPTVGTPEEWQVYEQQMGRLKSEASDAGMYSAARGKAGKKLNYQQRIKKNF